MSRMALDRRRIEYRIKTMADRVAADCRAYSMVYLSRAENSGRDEADQERFFL
jgi:hypothetical protein